jgi:hypothetical protein
VCGGKVFEFLEKWLSCPYPLASYKQVFVDFAPATTSSYNTMSIIRSGRM